MSLSDTIFALASGSARAGVSVFRLSGPRVRDIVKSLTGRSAPKPRYAALREFRTADKTPIDEGLLIYFKGPNSFTGEDVAEFQTHGSPAVVAALSSAFREAGAREALPGEFTRRAFENGRMDLTAAEGLADLIDAETDGQRQQALRQMQGGLKDTYENWREGLINALASIEGEIDFPDEQDVPDALAHIAYEPITQVLEDMLGVLQDAERGERVRAGINVAIIGAPNAGKSTLINRLAGRDAAIVSDEAGTTRDIIDVHLDIAGLPVQVSDTAGLRETDNKIEAEGVRRALARSEDSDLRIGVIDTTEPDLSVLESLKDKDFLLLNKSDQSGKNLEISQDLSVFNLSAKTGDGFEPFYKALKSAISERFSLTEQAGLTRARHRDCVGRAVEALDRARQSLAIAPELSGDDIRTALHAIKELAGEADIEAVLDAIFSRFCIGK